jgi:wyosine [tRNA(Phe)-imidazoG37] synthetase (radical SAM superfamily)
VLTFGPVPSRRLGRSLGINNIPPKICSFSCLYCQVGRTDTLRITRQAFYDPKAIVAEVQRKIEKITAKGESLDFLSFVPDGEPTLDIHLGRTIDLLRPLGIKIAVISNASLLPQKSVRDDLAKADWVSLKVDAVTEKTWRRINRPHRDLDLEIVLEAMLRFAKEYTGELVSETMLVEGINDNPETVNEVGEFLGQLQPARAYLSIPTRPPAESVVHPPPADVLNLAYQLISKTVPHVECLFGYEGNAFSTTGDIAEDLIGIVAVHPMPEEAVQEFLAKAGGSRQTIDKLLAEGRLAVTRYQGKKFYLRRIKESAI